ncbi:MAG: hypothetical protein WBC60_18735 [Cognaticolwellia sp.]
MHKYRGSIAGFLGGTVYAIIFSYLFSIGEKYSINFLEFISIAMLIILPVSVGIITVLFLTKEQAINKNIRTFHPWLPVLAWSIISVALSLETIICIIMLLPLYLPLSSFGGFLGGYIRRNYCEKTNVGVASCFAILPLLIAPIERPLESPTLFYSASNTIEIYAPVEKVWEEIPNIDNIQSDELSWNLSHFIGIPKPVSAITKKLKVGGLRELSWERGVHFQEKITELTANKKLAYQVIVDQESMSIAELDTHIVVGDKYFDVLSGSYELEFIDGITYLSLTTDYRMTSKVNWYGSLWANYVLDDFHMSVLNLIKNRVEKI